MNFRSHPLLAGALTGFAIGLLVLAVRPASPSIFGLEWLWSDTQTRRLSTKLEPDPGIVILAINESSVATLEELNYGRPPWTRELMGRIVEEARRGGARLVVFDLLFSEEHFYDPSGDRRFAASLESMPVVLGAQTAIPEGPPAEIGAPWRRLLWRVEGRDPATPRSLIAPIPLLSAAEGIGTLQLQMEKRASVTRRYATLLPVAGGGWVPSLALTAAARANGWPRQAAWEEGSGVLQAGSLEIPVGKDGTFPIRWRRGATGREGHLSYPAVDASALIEISLARDEGADEAELDRMLRSRLEGKIALVGYTAAGQFDLRSTPLSPASAGVEIHANALDDLLRGDFNRAVPSPLFAVLLLLVTAFLGAVVARIDSQPLAAVAFLAVAAAWLGASAIALDRGYLLPAAAPVIAAFLTWVTITVTRFIAEQKRSSYLKGTFGRYVSPQILDYLIHNPDKVRLGGERRDLTILFSDIRGFTTISEGSEPEEVVEMLNEYLTRMVDILLRHGGTLDKFIGDAVMGFWNAPTPVEDHPRRAVECAIGMVEETARLREQWEAEGKPALRIGVGLNTGEAVVGNIGSDRVFGYTVIGDAVNLASRLEGKNKDYGTEIIVSESTYQRMGEGIPAFYLGEVQVKGKQQAVRIYEIRRRSI